jgi:trimeric autotransporter adhesin
VGSHTTLTETATNPNAVGLSFTSAVANSATNDYVVGTDTCSGNTIPPNGTCTIAVTFTPTITGSDPGTLTVNTNATSAFMPVTLGGRGQ